MTTLISEIYESITINERNFYNRFDLQKFFDKFTII